MAFYDVVILKEGYSRELSRSQFTADCTITLLKGRLNILVDTGNPSDKDCVIQALANQNLSPSDIHYVICTHGHLDHVGNLNLFNKAVIVVGKDICLGADRYDMHDFESDRFYEIDENVHVMFTPGHTCSDVSVLVNTSNLGKVVVSGDIFEREEDLEDPSIWMELSEHKKLQEESRLKILSMADVIIPGHGPMFSLKSDVKRHISIVEEEDAESPDPDSDQEHVLS